MEIIFIKRLNNILAFLLFFVASVEAMEKKRMAKKRVVQAYNESQNKFGVCSLRQIATDIYVKKVLTSVFETNNDADTMEEQIQTHLSVMPEDLRPFVVQRIPCVYNIDFYRNTQKKKSYQKTTIENNELHQSIVKKIGTEIYRHSFSPEQQKLGIGYGTTVSIFKKNNDTWDQEKEQKLTKIDDIFLKMVSRGFNPHNIYFLDSETCLSHFMKTITIFNCKEENKETTQFDFRWLVMVKIVNERHFFLREDIKTIYSCKKIKDSWTLGIIAKSSDYNGKNIQAFEPSADGKFCVVRSGKKICILQDDENGQKWRIVNLLEIPDSLVDLCMPGIEIGWHFNFQEGFLTVIKFKKSDNGYSVDTFDLSTNKVIDHYFNDEDNWGLPDLKPYDKDNWLVPNLKPELSELCILFCKSQGNLELLEALKGSNCVKKLSSFYKEQLFGVQEELQK